MQKFIIKIIDKEQNIYKNFETNYILEVENIIKNDGKKYEVIFREIDIK